MISIDKLKKDEGRLLHAFVEDIYELDGKKQCIVTMRIMEHGELLQFIYPLDEEVKRQYRLK